MPITDPSTPSATPVPAAPVPIVEAVWGSLYDVPPLGALAPRGIVVQGWEPTHRIHPTLFELERVHAVPWDWFFLTEDGRALADGTAINPLLLRKGVVPHVQPAGPGRCRIALDVGLTVEEPCLFIGGDLFANYYHWIVDFLPRLVTARRLAERAGRSLPLAIAGNRPAFADAVIALAGVAPERILTIPHDRATAFRTVRVISSFTQYGVIHPATLEAVLPLRPAPAAPAERLYVSRGDARYRRVANEAEVLAALGGLGFRVVHPSSLTLEDQRTLFARAEIVVGAHGAGLTNLIWSPDGCPLIEMKPWATGLTQFQLMAKALARPYQLLQATPADTLQPGVHNSDYRVDVERLVGAVRAHLTAGGRA